MLSLCPGSCHTPTLLCVLQTRSTISAQVRAGLPLPTRRAVNLCAEIYSFCAGADALVRCREDLEAFNPWFFRYSKTAYYRTALHSPYGGIQ